MSPRFASVSADGEPHLVPVTFAVLGDRIVFVVDDKAKTTTRLRRLDNIRAIVTTVDSGCHSRDACLYGCVTWMTSATPGSASMRDASTRPSLPTSPTAVRCAPGIGLA